MLLFVLETRRVDVLKRGFLLLLSIISRKI